MGRPCLGHSRGLGEDIAHSGQCVPVGSPGIGAKGPKPDRRGHCWGPGELAEDLQPLRCSYSLPVAALEDDHIQCLEQHSLFQTRRAVSHRAVGRAAPVGALGENIAVSLDARNCLAHGAFLQPHSQQHGLSPASVAGISLPNSNGLPPC